MSREIEAFGLVKRACELYIESTSHLLGTDIIGNTINEALDIIEQTITKAQEPKHYLKWEDLKFTYDEQKIKVRLNGENYTVVYFIMQTYDKHNEYEYVGVLKDDDIIVYSINSCWNTAYLLKQFFNNLHLERVE